MVDGFDLLLENRPDFWILVLRRFAQQFGAVTASQT